MYIYIYIHHTYTYLYIYICIYIIAGKKSMLLSDGCAAGSGVALALARAFCTKGFSSIVRNFLL